MTKVPLSEESVSTVWALTSPPDWFIESGLPLEALGQLRTFEPIKVTARFPPSGLLTLKANKAGVSLQATVRMGLPLQTETLPFKTEPFTVGNPGCPFCPKIAQNFSKFLNFC